MELLLMLRSEEHNKEELREESKLERAFHPCMLQRREQL